MSARTSKQLIVNAFKPGDFLLSAEVIRRTGLSLSYVCKMLTALTAENVLARTRTGNGNRHGGSLEFTYCLKQDEVREEKAPATLPAYRNLRLDETLTGYNGSLFSFASLCMEARK